MALVALLVESSAAGKGKLSFPLASCLLQLRSISYQSNINYSFYNLKSILSLLPYARISRSLALCPSLSLLFEEGYVDSSTSMLLLISAAFMLSSLHLKSIFNTWYLWGIAVAEKNSKWDFICRS